MAKLKLGSIDDDKPVKLTVELPAAIHRDLVAYGQVLARETGQGAPEPAKLIAPIIGRFMAADRAFAKLRRPGPASFEQGRAKYVLQGRQVGDGLSRISDEGKFLFSGVGCGIIPHLRCGIIEWPSTWLERR